MKRQIVQIAGNADAFALCSDGTAWIFYDSCEEWHQLPPIPQDPEAQEVTALRKLVDGDKEA